MRLLRLWRAKAKGLPTRKRQDQEFDAEIQSHLDLLTERYARRRGKVLPLCVTQ